MGKGGERFGERGEFYVSPPLAGEREGGPIIRIGKILRVQKGQLRLAPRLGARLALASARQLSFRPTMTSRFRLHLLHRKRLPVYYNLTKRLAGFPALARLP
jgi:hypothetical protein